METPRVRKIKPPPMTPPIGRTQSVGLQLFAPLLPVGKAFVSFGPEFVELEMALVFIIALSFESVFNSSWIINSARNQKSNIT